MPEISNTKTIAPLVFGEESGLVRTESFREQYPLKNAGLMLRADTTSDDAPFMLWINLAC
jgi:hypothetical protein